MEQASGGATPAMHSAVSTAEGGGDGGTSPPRSDSALPETAELGKVGPPRRKGRKGPARNIFLEFGMASDERAMTEIEIGGVVVKRFNIKRYWQSDRDLHRWQRGLHDNTRFDRLLTDVRGRWHPDFRADRADLAQNHNGYRRQRGGPMGEQKVTTAAQELVELRQRLDPRDSKGKRREKFDFGGLIPGASMKKASAEADMGYTAASSMFHDTRSSLNDAGSQSDIADAIARLLEFLGSRYGSLEAAFAGLDVNGSGQLSVAEFSAACGDFGFRSDVKCLVKVLDKGANGAISRAEFMRLKPYMSAVGGGQASPGGGRLSPAGTSRAPSQAEEEGFGPAATGAAAHPEARRGAARLVQVQQAAKPVALLVFRNGDLSHAGEPVLVRRWPPAGLAELLKVCSGGCHPFVGPAMKLLDVELRPIRSVDEVVPGAAYLLKGQEALDPPLLFFDHRERPSGSLRQLSRARHAAVAEQEDAPRRSPKLSSVSSSPLGSPQWSCQESSSTPSQLAKWQVDANLGMHLSWGGLGQPHQHHLFETWPRALLYSSPGAMALGPRSLSTPLL